MIITEKHCVAVEEIRKSAIALYAEMMPKLDLKDQEENSLSQQLNSLVSHLGSMETTMHHKMQRQVLAPAV